MSTCPLCKKKTIIVQDSEFHLRDVCDCNWYGPLYLGITGVKLKDDWRALWRKQNNE